MPKGVLFDLDGTLLDSAPDFIASLDSLLTKHNQPKLDPEIIRSHVSDGSWKLTSLGFKIDISDHKCSVLREELLDEYFLPPPCLGSPALACWRLAARGMSWMNIF